MSSATGLLPVADAAAEAIHSLMSAWETTITLIDGELYWDIVDVCDEPDGWPRFPDYRYPLASYPVGTDRMLSGRGYVSGDAVDEAMIEFERLWPEVPVGSLMSIPIIALGEVHGEVFLVRKTGSVPFNRDDLDVGAELATLFGARLPALVTAYFERRGDGSSSDSLPNLTKDLEEPVD
jgi:GAF domain-containing protein